MEPRLPAVATAPAGPAGPAGGIAAATAAGGPAQALAVAVGRELAATVASADGGALLLRVAGGLVQASGGEGLLPGMQVRLRVIEAGADRIVLQVLDPAAEAGGAGGAAGAGDLDRLLRGRLAPAVGGDAAGALARALGARGAPAGETSVLAARFLSGETSPVALLRSLAAAGKPGLAGLLAEAERLIASGNGPSLREALSVLGLDGRKRAGGTAGKGGVPAAAATTATTAATGPTADVKSALAGSPEPVAAQQLLLRPVGPALLFLPLPDGGEARVTIDDGAADPLKPLSVQLDLELPRLGRVGIRLHGHDGALWASVATADPAAAAALAGAAPALEHALGAATGRPSRVSVSARTPEPAVVAARADIYA